MILYIAMMSSLHVAILNNIDPTGCCVFCMTVAEGHKVVFYIVCYVISSDYCC